MVKSKISAGESGSKARLHKESDALKEATIFACSNRAGGGVSFIKLASKKLRLKAVQSLSNVVTVQCNIIRHGLHAAVIPAFRLQGDNSGW